MIFEGLILTWSPCRVRHPRARRACLAVGGRARREANGSLGVVYEGRRRRTGGNTPPVREPQFCVIVHSPIVLPFSEILEQATRPFVISFPPFLTFMVPFCVVQTGDRPSIVVGLAFPS